MRSKEGKAKQREAIRRWQKANPEKVKAAKQRYYSSEKVNCKFASSTRKMEPK
jgi:hypothetical protein